MRELKQLMLLALFFAFLGGIGAGAWIGSLTAGPAVLPVADDDRVAEFERILDLDATQVRQLRVILADHDHRVGRIRDEVTAQQFRRKLLQENASRQHIRKILSLKQRKQYDKLLGR